MLDVRSIIAEYLSEFPVEQEGGRLKQLLDFINNSNEREELVSRKNFVGHITASGFVISRSASKVLLVHHADLGMFLQPGGHFQPEDTSFRDAALREVRERTSISVTSLEYLPFHFDPDVPIDIDTHPIDRNDGLNEDYHFHHDFRYVFLCEEENLETTLDSVNSKSYQWVDLNQLRQMPTFAQIVPKIRRTLSNEFRPKRFFDSLAKSLDLPKRVSTIVVAHFIPDVLPYLNTLSQISDVRALIPKPKSIDAAIMEKLKRRFRIESVTREELANGDMLTQLIDGVSDEVVLFDIGGYFAGRPDAPLLTKLAESFPDKLLGVVEDTENGHQKYQALPEVPVPVYSVARSPLKDNEDLLVGQSVVFSADVILREVGKLIQYHSCSVFGYGKIGSSIAYHLLLRGVKPHVYDTDPIRRLKAHNELCSVPSRKHILAHSDIIFCATGNQSMKIHDFRQLKPGCFIFSVTSSDDEMDLKYLEGEYTGADVSESKHITKYSSFKNHFYLVNKGNAVNFIHKAVLGDFIHLVRGEMISALKPLLSAKPEPGLRKLKKKHRREIAKIWASAFIDDQTGYTDIS
jgi:8-oxo-dGTP pyrophosphatase MutT (NUDIX family)